MHNIIQELRGNVRVFARIRPFLPHEGDDNVPFVHPSGETTLQVVRGKQESKFQFDRVFAPSAGQDAVFDEVSEFVQSALDGYSVCLFSYGQTGSGKTHTMTGTGSGAMRGLIPRSIEQIGLHKKMLEQEGWEYTMECSFLEIYNEIIRDLLRDSKSSECKHEIKVGADGRRTVTNLTVKRIDPNDTDSIDSVLSRAAKRRSTASTDMNSVSSRSHSVFTLTITAKHEEMNKMISGTLNLVDLAGSERLDRSNATGQTAKEAVAINKSLSSLTDVFAAIGEHSKHVPFRNSKLTYLLQPCFSGDGKTLMVVNISPTEESVQESMCSLRFASSVNKCELGKAKRTFTKVR
jgi:kinesin family protein C1